MIETQKTESPNQTALRNDWLTRYSKAMARLVPDAISTVAIMVVLLFGLALALGNSFTTALDAWYRGLWMAYSANPWGMYARLAVLSLPGQALQSRSQFA